MARTVHLVRVEKEEQIEYSMAGAGVPILLFHGGHSNCQEEFGYKKLLEQGYAIITPSRAGYGNSSHELGHNLDTACKAYLKLINHLQLEKVHVIAISAGGPSGIYFASRFPDRVHSLTLQSAVSKEFLASNDMTYKVAKVLFHPSSEKYIWRMVGLLSRLFPKFMFKRMLPSFSKLPPSEVLKQLSDDDMSQFIAMNQRQRSGHGFMIDLEQSRSLSLSDLQTVKCPALIMHSKQDNTVSVEHAYHAHNHISNSKLCILDSWGHLIWLGRDSQTVEHQLSEFLLQCDAQEQR